jgi:hypothetical protein
MKPVVLIQCRLSSRRPRHEQLVSESIAASDGEHVWLTSSVRGDQRAAQRVTVRHEVAH